MKFGRQKAVDAYRAIEETLGREEKQHDPMNNINKKTHKI